MNKGWAYILKNKRFALEKDVPYKAVDGTCDYASKQNVISNVIPQTYTRVASGNDNLLQATYISVPAVAITVESDFYGYKSGVYDGCATVKSIHHAVVVVGYDTAAWKVKNSWGTGWGQGGYIRMSRARPSICRIAHYAMYPNVDLMAGLVTIKNTQTGRFLAHWDNQDDVRGRRGTADGWSYGTTYAYATDGNYYNTAFWKLIDLGDGKVHIENFHSGRWLHADGAVVDPATRGKEGGWTNAPHIRVTDADYYGHAIWHVNQTTTAAQHITHHNTKRFLFAAGSHVKPSGPSGGFGSVKVHSVDANYYNCAEWEIKPITAAQKNRNIASG